MSFEIEREYRKECASLITGESRYTYRVLWEDDNFSCHQSYCECSEKYLKGMEDNLNSLIQETFSSYQDDITQYTTAELIDYCISANVNLKRAIKTILN